MKVPNKERLFSQQKLKRASSPLQRNDFKFDQKSIHSLRKKLFSPQRVKTAIENGNRVNNLSLSYSVQKDHTKTSKF
jgi:hypothetical protein